MVKRIFASGQSTMAQTALSSMTDPRITFVKDGNGTVPHQCDSVVAFGAARAIADATGENVEILCVANGGVRKQVFLDTYQTPPNPQSSHVGLAQEVVSLWQQAGSPHIDYWFVFQGHADWDTDQNQLRQTWFEWYAQITAMLNQPNLRVYAQLIPDGSSQVPFDDAIERARTNEVLRDLKYDQPNIITVENTAPAGDFDFEAGGVDGGPDGKHHRHSVSNDMIGYRLGEAAMGLRPEITGQSNTVRTIAVTQETYGHLYLPAPGVYYLSASTGGSQKAVTLPNARTAFYSVRITLPTADDVLRIAMRPSPKGAFGKWTEMPSGANYDGDTAIRARGPCSFELFTNYADNSWTAVGDLTNVTFGI